MAEGENTVRERLIRSAFLQTLGFDSRARTPNLKFIRGMFPLPFSSILSELFFLPVICLLFMSAGIQDKFEYTSIVCPLTWDFVESFLSFFFLSLLGCHNKLIRMRPRLIIVPFLVDKSFFSIRLTRLTMLRCANSLKEAFSFLSVFPAQHYFGIWVSSVSQIMFSLSDEETTTS